MIFAVVFPLIAAFALWLLFKNRRSESDRAALSVLVILVSLVELAAAVYLIINDLSGAERATVGYTIVNGFGLNEGLGLHFRYTGFRGVFGALTAAAWFVTFLFSREFQKNDTRVIRYDFFNLLTLAATMGIFYAADLFTFFFFFEIMSFTSFLWVAHRQTVASQYAAGTYLGIAVAGGMAILMGIFIVSYRLGTLEFSQIGAWMAQYLSLYDDRAWLYAAAGCMFVGFGAKAGAFPVHVWLPASYTEAPAPATALLSSVLSKTGVFGILLVTLELMRYEESWGMFLVVIGLFTMIIGGVRGVMSGNLKTTLAYSSMSQIGFMLVGAGMIGLFWTAELRAFEMTDYVADEAILNGYRLAANGTFLHMVNHSLIKLALFLLAGVIFGRTGSYDLNRVRGYGRNKPFLWVTFLVAAAGVGGIPLLNGYVSKTLLHESITEYAALAGGGTFRLVEYLFLFSGGLTVAYMVKLFIVLFVEKNTDAALQEQYDADKNYASFWSKAAIGVCALPILLIGVLPNIFADALAEYGADLDFWSLTSIRNVASVEAVHYFSLENLSGALISIVTGAVVYLVVVRLWMLRKKSEGYRELFPAWLDLEKYVYRAVFFRFIPFVLGIISRILDSVVDTLVVLLRKSVYRDRPLPYELPEGNRATHFLGKSMDAADRLYCAVKKTEYRSKNHEHQLAMKKTDLTENMYIIVRSLSFGLFMFCVGLGLTLIYLLVVN